jgi:hypothetical protein
VINIVLFVSSPPVTYLHVSNFYLFPLLFSSSLFFHISVYRYLPFLQSLSPCTSSSTFSYFAIFSFSTSSPSLSPPFYPLPSIPSVPPPHPLHILFSLLRSDLFMTDLALIVFLYYTAVWALVSTLIIHVTRHLEFSSLALGWLLVRVRIICVCVCKNMHTYVCVRGIRILLCVWWAFMYICVCVSVSTYISVLNTQVCVWSYFSKIFSYTCLSFEYVCVCACVFRSVFLRFFIVTPFLYAFTPPNSTVIPRLIQPVYPT